MRFVVDAQLPPALARMLAAAGHHAEHVVDVGLRDAEDIAIWQYALEHQAVVLTKDEDFVARSLRSDPAPVVVWLRVGPFPEPVRTLDAVHLATVVLYGLDVAPTVVLSTDGVVRTNAEALGFAVAPALRASD